MTPETLVIPLGPEILGAILIILLPIAFIYIAYKLIQGFQAYNEGKQRQTQ